VYLLVPDISVAAFLTKVCVHEQIYWNDVQCPDKSGNACYLKCCICAYTNNSVFWLAHLTLCITMLRKFQHYLDQTSFQMLRQFYIHYLSDTLILYHTSVILSNWRICLSSHLKWHYVRQKTGIYVMTTSFGPFRRLHLLSITEYAHSQCLMKHAFPHLSEHRTSLLAFCR